MAKIRLLTILLMPLFGICNDISIEIRIAEQRLYVLQGPQKISSYAISSSSYGIFIPTFISESEELFSFIIF